MYDKRTADSTFLDIQQVDLMGTLDSPRVLVSHLPAQFLPKQVIEHVGFIPLLLLLGRPQWTTHLPPALHTPLTHQPMPVFLQPTLSSIAAGKQSLGTPVSASSTSSLSSAALLPCFGSHKTKSLATSCFTPPPITTEPKVSLSLIVAVVLHKAPHL